MPLARWQRGGGGFSRFLNPRLPSLPFEPPRLLSTFQPACDETAAAAHVSKPEICGGAWRNSVYRIVSADQCEHATNPDLEGPVTDNAIAGWDTHNCVIDIVDQDGRTGVVRNTDAGGFSDLFMTVNTIPGTTYSISFDVWTESIENTAGNDHCTSTDSNGQLAINAGPLQLGCETGGYCDHGEVMLCPTEAGVWTTVTGEYTAVGPMTTLRLHGESAYTAYFDSFTMTGRCSSCNLVVNNNIKGPVVDNTLSGWETHNCLISIVDFEGRSGVLKNEDAGSFSDVYQTVNTVVGVTYTISYEVYAVNSQVNTAANDLCTTTDQNGVLAVNAGHMNGNAVNSAHGELLLCPSVDSRWTTVSGSYTATSTQTTLRLHGESRDSAYFDEITMIEELYEGDFARDEIAVNPELDGPLTDNAIAGWDAHNCVIDLVEQDGRTDVVQNTDAG
eukprot:COSAG06_NODE_11510_length_1500_cov_0.851535_1_plen_445_part_10